MRFERLLRTPLLARIFVWMAAHMSFALPVRRLRETATLIAFHHPRPSYPLHIVLLPKRNIPDLNGLAPDDAPFLVDLFQTVQSLLAEFQPPAYRLVANGGRYQDFPQLHFHLVADQVDDSL